MLWSNTCVRMLQNILQLLHDTLILRSISSIAYVIMTMHDIVFSMSILGGDVVVKGYYIWRRRAASCHVRTLLSGPEGVHS